MNTNEPKGPGSQWTSLDAAQQTVERLEREVKGMQDIVRKAYALQTAHTALRGLVREVMEAWVNGRKVCAVLGSLT